MDPILLDTNAYSAFKRGDTDAVEVIRRAPVISRNAVVLGELLGGFAAGAKAHQNRAELATFLASPRVSVIPVDHATSDHYASVYVSLRLAGTPIPTNDMWIAASALQHRLRLFSLDDHFKSVPGLKVGTTLAELTGP